MWTKRMPLGLGPLLDEGNEFRIERESWTMADVVASAPSQP